MIGPRREKVQSSMWPAAVVVGAVLSEDGPQVPFAEDQDAVGEFCSGGQNESFGEAVRSRTSRWDHDAVDTGAGEDGVERAGELPSAVADEDPEGGGTVRHVADQGAVTGRTTLPRSRETVAGRPDGSIRPACGYLRAWTNGVRYGPWEWLSHG